MHENYDKHFGLATAVQAEGARIGICVCKECGAAILLDPRDPINAAKLHAEWHAAIAGSKT